MVGRGVKVPFRERYATSRAIFRQSWTMLKQERDLWVFPVLATLGMLAMVVPVVLAVTFARGALFGWMPTSFVPFAFVLLLPLAYPFGVAVSLCNAALCFAAHERLAGRKGRKRAAWKRAWSQLGPIARFNAIALLVGGVLAALGQLLDKVRLVPFVGQALQMVGTFAWAAASYFVIPILVVEREGRALDALRGSVALARKQWGKTTAGIVTIGLAMMVPMFALLLLFVGPVMAIPFFAPGSMAAWLPIFFVILAIYVVAMLAFSMLASAFSVLYQTALYRYAKTGQVSKPFDAATLVDAWKPYQA